MMELIHTHTPSKHLHEISPVPTIPVAFNKTLKQSAAILISQEHINRRKAADEKNRTRNISGVKKLQTKAKRRKTPEESSEQKDNIYESNICCECWENYFTTSKSDWIQCG
jgi:hypothetical protein